MAAKTLAQVALEDMRIPGVTDYGASYAPNEVKPLGRRANGNSSAQYLRALLVQGRYPTSEGFTPANPDFGLELSWIDSGTLADLSSRTWGEILMWNHTYCTDEYGTSHSPGWIDNSRVQWHGWECWLRSKASGTWSRLVSTDGWGGHPIAPDFSVEDFSQTHADFRSESNGLQSVRLTYDNNAPYASIGINYWAYHGYAGGVQSFSASDVADVLVFAKISLVRHSASVADDREFARFACAIGADYYPTPRTYFYPSVGISRHKLVRARWPEWQYVVMHTMTAGQIASTGLPPSVANLTENFDTSGSTPVNPSPAGPAPTRGRWVSIYNTVSPKARWAGIGAAAASAPIWNQAVTLTAMIGTAFSYTPPLASGSPAPTFSKVSGPSWASVNSATGEITGTPSGSPTTATIVVRATNASGSSDISLTVNVLGSLTVTTGSPLPSATVGQAYTQPIVVAGGIAPYTYEIVSGSLPAVLVLSNGIITGTASAAGTSNFTVRVRDAVGATTDKAFVLSAVDTSTAPVITTGTLPYATAGTAYSQTLAATGTAPITWSITAGSLPSGLSLNSSTGAITGTPSLVGSSPFVARASNASGASTASLTIIVVSAVSQAIASPWIIRR